MTSDMGANGSGLLSYGNHGAGSHSGSHNMLAKNYNSMSKRGNSVLRSAITKQPSASAIYSLSGPLATSAYNSNFGPAPSLQSETSSKSLQKQSSSHFFDLDMASKYTLTFRDPETESHYAKYFVSRAMKSWRITLMSAMIVYILAYIYAMVKYPLDAAVWATNYETKTIPEVVMYSNLTAYCPTGYFCSPCPDNLFCGSYRPWVDAVLLVLSLLPGFGAIGLSYYWKESMFGKYCHLLSAIFVVMGCIFTIIVRFAIVEPNTTAFLSGCFLVLLMHCAFNGLQLRFIYTAATLPLILIAWIISQGLYISSTSDEINANSVVIVGLSLLMSAVVIPFNSYSIEMFYREQFLRSQQYQKTNAKLMDQLKSLQRSYGGGALDFDSPLEKSIAICRGMMADPNLSVDHIHNLGLLLQLLNSRELLSPDIEGQLKSQDLVNQNGPATAIDTEQKAWLFSEIAKRRLDGAQRMATANRNSRRKSTVTGAPVHTPFASTTPAAGSSLGEMGAVGSRHRDSSNSLSTTIATPPTLLQSSIPNANSPLSKVVDTISNRQSNLDAGSSNGSGGAMAVHASSISVNPQGAATVIPPLSAISLGSNIFDLESGFDSHAAILANQAAMAMGSLSRPSISLPPKAEEAELERTSQSTTGFPLTSSPSMVQIITTNHSLLAQSHLWNWKIFDFCDVCPGGKPLFTLVYYFFQRSGLLTDFNIPTDKFSLCMWKIQEGYRSALPYHNSIHATDVLHAVAYFINTETVNRFVSSLDLLAIYYAAAIHDYDHYGVNNNFLITTNHPIAILYNDKAVLESHHLAASFDILLKPENNFLSHFSRQDYQAFRELVIEMVLATDLSQHYSLLSLFKTRLQNSFNPAESKEDRNLLYRILLKCADVSNPTKDQDIYTRWMNLVLEEFWLQGDEEKKMKMTVSPFMDRENPGTIVSSQSGFIEYILVPMFETLNTGYLKLPVVMEGLERNRQYWAKVKENREKETKESDAKQAESKGMVKQAKGESSQEITSSSSHSIPKVSNPILLAQSAPNSTPIELLNIAPNSQWSLKGKQRSQQFSPNSDATPDSE